MQMIQSLIYEKRLTEYQADQIHESFVPTGSRHIKGTGGTDEGGAEQSQWREKNKDGK